MAFRGNLDIWMIEIAKEDSERYARFMPVEIIPWVCGLIADPVKLYDGVIGMLPTSVVPGGGLMNKIMKKFVVYGIPFVYFPQLVS